MKWHLLELNYLLHKWKSTFSWIVWIRSMPSSLWWMYRQLHFTEFNFAFPSTYSWSFVTESITPILFKMQLCWFFRLFISWSYRRIFFMRVIMLNNQAWILTGSSNISGSSFFWFLRLVVKADRRRIIFFGCTEQCQGCNGPSIVYCCFYYNHSHSTKNVCICNFHEIKWVIYIVNSDCA